MLAGPESSVRMCIHAGAGQLAVDSSRRTPRSGSGRPPDAARNPSEDDATRAQGAAKTAHGTVYDIFYSANGKRYPPIRGKFTNLEAANRHRLDLIHQANHGTAIDAGKPRQLAASTPATIWLPDQQTSVRTGELQANTVYQRTRGEPGAASSPPSEYEQVRHIDLRKVKTFQRDQVNEELSNFTACSASSSRSAPSWREASGATDSRPCEPGTRPQDATRRGVDGNRSR